MCKESEDFPCNDLWDQSQKVKQHISGSATEIIKIIGDWQPPEENVVLGLV